jgi:hypothetical protein
MSFDVRKCFFQGGFGGVAREGSKYRIRTGFTDLGNYGVKGFGASG